MGLLGLFKKRSKKLKYNVSDLDNFFVVDIKRKNIEINSYINIPEQSIGIACFKNKVCDVLNIGEVFLNFNSLPNLFKKGKYNSPNKYGRMPNAFAGEIYILSLCDRVIEFNVGEYRIKDEMYGRQKINLELRVTFKLNDAQKFLKIMLSEHRGLHNGKALLYLSHWFSEDIIKYMKKQNYNIDDYMCYTKGFNNDLHSLLANRFSAVGVEILSVELIDIVLDEKLVRDINENRSLSLNMNERDSGYDATICEDGVQYNVGVTYDCSQTQGSLAEKYTTVGAQSEYEQAMNEVIEDDCNKSFFDNLVGQTPNAGSRCKFCGNPIEVGSAYCRNCGNRLDVGYVICPLCSTENAPESNFCKNCGAKLK